MVISVKKNLRFLFYTIDPFKKWSDYPPIENFPLIHLLIYKKKFFSGHFEDIFVNKVDFGQIAYLVKLLYCWPWQPQLLIFFNNHGKMKMGPIRAKSMHSKIDFQLHCNSESGGWPHAQTGGRRPKILCVGYPPI